MDGLRRDWVWVRALNGGMVSGCEMEDLQPRTHRAVLHGSRRAGAGRAGGTPVAAMQIDKLERELADGVRHRLSMGGLDAEPARGGAAPRLLDLGELERVRDDLAARVRSARATIAERADLQAENRVALERMLLDPGRYRFMRISNREIGEPGCGVWQVKSAARAGRDADGLVAGQALLRLSVSHRPRRAAARPARGGLLSAPGDARAARS